MYCNGGEKIKLGEESISQILVADTDSESGSDPSEFEDYLKEKEEESPQQQQQQKQQISAEVETHAARNGELPNWGQPQGRNKNVPDGMTATHATVRHLTSRFECLRHKTFMDNFFSSPRLFDDLDRP